MPVASELLVKIGADTAQAEQGIARVDKQIGTFARGAGALGGIATAAFAGIGVAAIGLGAGLGSAVSTAADFEHQIAGVGSLVNATSAQIQQLSDAALQLGQDTTLSGIGASDAANAMQQLAAAGFSVDDMTGGVTRGVLLLASATGTAVPQAAEIAGDAFNEFRKSMGLTAQDMPRIANLFVGAANVSSIGLSDIGQSMQYIGPIAASLGISIDDVTAAIAELGNQGIKGSEAGTALRTMLVSITSPSKEAAKTIADLGLNFVDSQGHVKDFAGIAEELKTKLAGLTDQQRAAALSTIFGREAVAAATVLYGDGAKGIQDYIDQINAQGDAAAQGAARNDNLAGSVQALGGVVETLKITIGRQLTPALKAWVDWAARVAQSAIPLVDRWGPRLVSGLQSGIRRAVAVVQSFGTAILAVFNSLRTGDFSNLFGPLIIAISTAFGGRVAGMVTLFVSNLVRGLNLARDAVLTVRQALAGDWFGGQDRSINVFVRSIGRFAQLARDAFITIRQAWDRNWISAPEIQPFVRAIGEVTVAVRAVADALVAAGRRFAAAFTTERLAILKQLGSDLLAVYAASQRLRFDALLTALGTLATILPPIGEGLGKIVGWLIDGLGWLQSTGHEVDVLNAALIALGAWIGLNKLADLVTGLGNAAKAAKDAGSAFADFLSTVTRGPRLVITTVRTVVQTVYQAAGKAARIAGDATRTVTTIIQTAFASAKDAVIWGQLYGEAAVQKVTKVITTAYEAIPKPPPLPDLIQKVTFAIPPFPKIATPTLQLQVAIPTPSLGTLGTDIGTKLAAGIASGIGIAIGGAIAASGAGAAIGGALIAAAPLILAAIGVVAQGVGIYFMAQLVAGLVQQAGGLGPYLANIFLVAVPYALGAVAGALANLGLELVLLILNGITTGIPALISFVQANFQTIVTIIALTLAPLPTLIYGILQQIGPTIVGVFGQIVATVTTAGAQILGAIGSAFSQVGTIVSTALSTIGGIVGNAFSAIGTAVQNALAPVGALIQAIIQGDWGAAFQAGIQLVVNIVATLPAAILGIVADAMGQVAGVIGDAWAGIIGVVGDALGQIGGIVAGAWGTIVATVADAGAQILGAVQSAWQSVTTAVSTAIDSIASAVATWLANLVTGFQSTFNTDLLTAVQTGITGIQTTITNGLNTAKDLAQTALDGIATAATTAMGNLRDAISNGIDTARTTISNGVSGFADLVLGVGPALYSAGASIIGMLSSGIESAIGGAIQKVKDGLAQISNLLPHSEPKDPSSPLRGLTDSGRAIFAMFAEGIRQGTPDAVKAAAEAASAVAKAITDGLAALKALSSFDPAKNTPSAGQFGAVIGFLANTTAMLSEVAAQFSADALKAAGDFSDAAGKVATAIGNGVKALTDLVKFVPPADAAIYAFGKSLRAIVNDFAVLSEQITAEMYQEAADFADSAGKVVAIIGQGVSGFTALVNFVAPPVAAIYAFGKSLRAVVNDFAVLSEQITADMFTEAGVFAESVGKVVGVIGTGVAGFLALADYQGTPTSAINAFGKTIRAVVNDMALLAEQVTQDAADQAAKFAAGVGTVVGIIGNAVEGFTKLADPDFILPSQQAIDNLAYGIREMVAKFADLASTISAEGIKQAGALGDAAGSVFGALKDALDIFTALPRLVVPSAQAIDNFGIAVAYTVRRIGDFADQIGKDGIKRAQDFGASAGQIFGALKSATDVLTGLQKFPDLAKKAMDAFLTGIQQVVQRMTESTDQAGEFAKQAAGYKAQILAGVADVKAAQQALNTIGSIGGGPDLHKLGQGIGGSIVDGARDALDSHSPSQVMAAIGRDVVAGLVQGMDSAQQDALQKAAEVASAVADAISKTFDSLTKIGGFAFTADRQSGLYAVGKALRAAVNDFALIAEQVTQDAADAAGKFADGAGKVADTVGRGVAAFAGLGGFAYTDAMRAGLYALDKAIRAAVDDLAIVAEQVTVDSATLAGQFADGAARVVAIVGDGVKNLAALADFRAPTDAAIDAFAATVGRLMAGIARATTGLTGDGLTLAGQFADAAGKVLGIIGNGVTGLKDLLTFVAPAQSAMDAFAAAVRDMMATLASVAGTIATEGATAAATFADAVGKVFAGLNAGTSFFKSLDNLLLPDQAGIDRILAPILATVRAVAAAASALDPATIAAALAGADVIGKVMAGVQAGNQALAPVAATGGGGGGGNTYIYEFNMQGAQISGFDQFEDQVVGALEDARRRGRID